MCIALVWRYLSGRYAGSGGNGEDVLGIEPIVVCVRIDDSEGRGLRNDDLGACGAYIPRPNTAFSGHEGSKWTVEPLLDGASVREDNDVELRHVKAISENVVRSTEALYGSMSGRSGDSLVMPKRWHRKGSDVLCRSMKSAQEVSLRYVSVD